MQTPDAYDPSGKVVHTRYFHCEVHAPSTVLNCTGELIRGEVKKIGGFEPVTAFKPPLPLLLDSVAGLVWQRIEPGLPGRINLVCQQSDQSVALLCVPSHAPQGNLTVLPPGEYRLTVRVRADDVETIDGTFLVRATNAWSDLDVALATNVLRSIRADVYGLRRPLSCDQNVDTAR